MIDNYSLTEEKSAELPESEVERDEANGEKGNSKPITHEEADWCGI